MDDYKVLWLSLAFISLLIASFLALHGPAGSDAIAYQAFACTGNPAIREQLTTWWTFYPCFNWEIIIFNVVLTVLLVFSLTVLIQTYTKKAQPWFVLVLFGVTPLFFNLAFGQPNQLAGTAVSFVGIMFLEAGIINKRVDVAGCGLILVGASALFWLASPITLLIPVLFRYNKKNLWHKLGLIALFIVVGIVLWPQISGLFTNIMGQSPSTEQASGLGIIFIVPFFIFWKRIPEQMKIISAVFLIMGLIHAKYMFLAVPWLTVGLLSWLEETKLKMPELERVAIPLFLALLCGLSAFMLLGSLFPTAGDQALADKASLYSDAGITPIYWNYDFKWLMVKKGWQIQPFDSPDWNNLQRPFYAIIREDDNLNCQILEKDDQQPLKYYLQKCAPS